MGSPIEYIGEKDVVCGGTKKVIGRVNHKTMTSLGTH